MSLPRLYKLSEVREATGMAGRRSASPQIPPGNPPYWRGPWNTLN